MLKISLPIVTVFSNIALIILTEKTWQLVTIQALLLSVPGTMKSHIMISTILDSALLLAILLKLFGRAVLKLDVPRSLVLVIADLSLLVSIIQEVISWVVLVLKYPVFYNL